MSLKLVTKIAAFEKPPRDGVLPSAPVVGERYIAVDADGGLLTLLDRRTLDVVQRRKRALQAVRWIGPEQLVVGGPRATGVWDVARKEYAWRLQNVRGGYVWRDWVIVWRDDRHVELRNMATGEVDRMLDVGPGALGYSRFCGDYLITTTPTVGDPLRAFDLAGERILWTRDVLAEIDRRQPDGLPQHGPSSSPTSSSDRFVVMRNGVMSACAYADGSVLWTATVYVPYAGPLAERGLIPVLSSLNRFTVIDESTGTLLCDRRHPELQAMYRQRRGSIFGNLFVTAAESGHVAAFDLRSGDLVHLEYHARASFWGSAVADDRLLVSATDGKVWVYETA